jgi:hypothetical protein
MTYEDLIKGNIVESVANTGTIRFDLKGFRIEMPYDPVATFETFSTDIDWHKATLMRHFMLREFGEGHMDTWLNVMSMET